MAAQLWVCVELRSMSGETTAYFVKRNDNIADLSWQVGEASKGHATASTDDCDVEAVIVYPGSTTEVPESICIDAFWEGKMDYWFQKFGVDMSGIRDQDGVLRFDVVLGRRPSH